MNNTPYMSPDGESFSSENEISNDEYSCPTVWEAKSAEISTLLLLFVCLVVLTLVTRRKNPSSCCGNRCGMMMPVTFVEDIQERMMVLSVFAIATFEIYTVLLGSGGDLADKHTSDWIATLIRLGLVMKICLLFLPILTCISREDLLCNMIGAAYSTQYCLSKVMTYTYKCSWKDMTTMQASSMFIAYGLFGVPGIYLGYRFLRRIFKESENEESRTEIKKNQEIYVRQILSCKRNSEHKHRSGLKKLKKVFINLYKFSSVTRSKYSLLILISIISGIILIVVAMLTYISYVYYARRMVLELIHDLKEAGVDMQVKNVLLNVIKVFVKKKYREQDYFSKTISFMDFLRDQVNILYASFFLCLIIPLLSTIYISVNMILSYKKNILGIYRQHYTDHVLNVENFGKVNLVVTAAQYGGFQVAHMLWGFHLQAGLLFVILFLFGEFAVVVFKNHLWGVLLGFLDDFGPIIAIIIATSAIQYLMVKYFFLQEKGNLLALDNRKGFYILMYFMFFYNAMRGMFTCLSRIIKAILFGVWFFPRLDRSIFPRSFEKFDAGFCAYACLLKLEEVQNNPIVLTFLRLAEKPSPLVIYNTRSCSGTSDLSIIRPVNVLKLEEDVSISSTRIPKSIRARNKWFVAWTLLFNESLRTQRKKILLPCENFFTCVRPREDTKSIVHSLA